MPGDELEMPGDEHKNISSWPWSPEEDTIILEMHSQLGPLWSQIVRQLPGRTVSSVRNRWQRIAMLLEPLAEDSDVGRECQPRDGVAERGG